MPPTIVPAKWIRKRELHYWMEELQCINAPASFGNLLLPPPTLGTYILLELSDNNFFANPRTAGITEAARAVGILQDARAAVQAVTAMIRDDFAPINKLMYRVIADHKQALVDHYEEIAAWIRDVPWYGFDMMSTGRDGESEPYLFSGPTVGAVVYTARNRLGCSVGEALWQIPVCLIGHLQVAHRRAEGETLHRPDDPEDIREQLRLARERNEWGNPHPWELGYSRSEWDRMMEGKNGG